MSICAQMSTAMMSAPSCASRMACERPCPRAAPVMKAQGAGFYFWYYLLPMTQHRDPAVD